MEKIPIWLGFLILTVVGGASGFGLGFLAGKLIYTLNCREYKLATKYLFETALKGKYFYSYELKDVLEKNFFYRFRQFSGTGFCFAISSLIMIALKDNKTARIVRGYVRRRTSTEHFYHSWVEFRYRGEWWVVDPSLIIPSCSHRCAYYQIANCEIEHVYSYQKFWSYPIVSSFYERLCHPETSYLFKELHEAFKRYPEHQSGFHPHISELKLRDDTGQRQSYKSLYGYFTDAVFSSEIVDDYMRKANRIHPKARTLRRYYAYMKSISHGVVTSRYYTYPPDTYSAKNSSIIGKMM